MSELPVPAGHTLVGRSRERELLDALLDRAAAGEAQTVLVSGSAGVGKTTLVAAVTGGRSATAAVGACLPLVSLRVPFLAVRAAVASVAGPEVAAALTGGEEASVPGQLDDWLGRRAAAGPVVLVIDDLHWADQGTLDALMFVIAGPPARRLAVVVTIRDDELGDGHPLQRWLPMIRRLPGVSELHLGPLDRVATGDQLAGLLGELPHQSLVEDVYRRSGGNPYLTRLIAAGLPPDALHAPAVIPSDLRAAVLQSWFRLSAQEREAAAVLAVGGAPLGAGEVAAVLESDRDVVLRHLLSAVEAGALEDRGDGTFWFPHPLNAEVLEHDVALDLRKRWHAGFADLLEQRPGRGSADQLVAIADHRHQAGDAEAAYRWAVRAGAALDESGAHARAARLWQRALALRATVDAAPESEDDLLTSLRRSAANAGAYDTELEAVEASLARIPPGQAPLVVAELLVRRTHLRFSTGRSFLRPDDLREAVRLSAVEPTSPQHALALAELAHAEFWQGAPDSPDLARRALAAARASQDDRALSFALTATAIAAVHAGDFQAGRQPAREAFEAALRAREWWGAVHALAWQANTSIDTWACSDYAGLLSRQREELAAAGAPHAYVAWISAVESSSWLAIGDWRECAGRLRDTVAAYPGELADVNARLTSARLAVWQGRQAEAEQHLSRADEVFADHSDFLAFEFDAVRAEVRLGARDPEGAYRAALAGTAVAGVAPTMCEWLIPLAARALADLAQGERDAGARSPDALLLLDDLEARFPEVIPDFFESTPRYERQLAAFQAWYAAEVARARRRSDEADRWIAATVLFETVELRWEQAYALRRAADSLLSSGAERAHGAALLRQGLDLAEQLQAAPLADELRQLATRARVPIRRPVDAQVNPASVRHGLTAREREILALLVAGRTYAEIAHALVISEKTVSSHVSNLLAKTGTANRIELAGYAVRSGLTPGS